MPLLKRIDAPIVTTPAQDVVTAEQVVKVAEIKKSAAKSSTSETMSKADWASKDTRISRQGLFQAALQSVGLLQFNTGTTLEEYLDAVEKTAERGLVFVNRCD